MPSGVFQATASRSPPGAERAAALRHACSAGDSSSKERVIGGIAAENEVRLSARRGDNPDHEKADSEPRRRRRPGRRHRPSRRAAGAHSRRPAPLQAPDARLADRDGSQDLGRDRPAAAGAAEHRHHAATRRGGPKAPSRAASLDAALDLAAASERVFVIGGAEIYALALPRADELELTEIDAEFPADTFFPAWDRGAFRQTSREAHATPKGCATASSAIDEPTVGAPPGQADRRL